MFNSLTLLFGKYAFEGVSLILTFLESQLAISLFCGQLKKDTAIRYASS